MKKVIKTVLAVVTIAAVGMGSYKAYGSYVAEDAPKEDALLLESVEAISQTIESEANSYLVKTHIGKCYKRNSILYDCPGGNEGHDDIYHISYDPVGEHYTCESRTWIPCPWAQKPSDECSGHKNCSSGTVTENRVPSEFQGGIVIEEKIYHDL